MLPKVVSVSLTMGVGRINDYGAALAAHESPLERGSYRVWLYLPYSYVDTGGSHALALLYGYHLRIPSASRAQVTFHRRSCAPIAPKLSVPSFTYSGHALFGTQRIVSSERPDVVIRTDLTDVIGLVRLSPYSGAFTYPTSKALVVSYFK
ncbi:hypothetical protein FB451DRAFT_1293305 [Mycena latifolia]|nr:hypothetical protein FB451DRAFT_1293305 [Mycena latifolia]